MKYNSSFDFFQPFKSIKTIISSWAVQKQAVGWSGPWAMVWQPLHYLYSNLKCAPCWHHRLKPKSFFLICISSECAVKITHIVPFAWKHPERVRKAQRRRLSTFQFFHILEVEVSATSKGLRDHFSKVASQLWEGKRWPALIWGLFPNTYVRLILRTVPQRWGWTLWALRGWEGRWWRVKPTLIWTEVEIREFLWSRTADVSAQACTCRSLFFFLRFFFDVEHFFKSLYWICYNIASVLCFVFLPWGACGILAPWPGIKPAPPSLEGEVLTTGPPGKSLHFSKTTRLA